MILSLLLATTLRTLLVIISFGCKVPAGIFVPSMAIGAAFGRTIGILVQALHEAFPASPFFSACLPDQPCITPPAPTRFWAPPPRCLASCTSPSPSW